MARSAVGFSHEYPKRMPRKGLPGGYPGVSQWYRKDRKLSIVPPPSVPTEPIAPDGEIMSINGKQVGSRNEWFIYQALRYRGIPTWSIEYQVYYGGGRMLGGQVLDFVIYLGGSPIVIRVMGKYWHPGGESGTPLDSFAKADLLNDGYAVYDISDSKCDSRETAILELQRQGLVI